MPEGPEVETVRRSLEPLLVGATLIAPYVSRKKLRTPITKKDLGAVAGAVVSSLFRKGKLLGIATERGNGLFVRLGMTGRLVVAPSATKAPLHTHVRFTLKDRGQELRFTDPRRFGEVVPFASPAERDAELLRLGPDGIALDEAGRAEVRAGLLSTSRAIKEALLDQTLVAGVGNIYAAEACFLARLSPFKRGVELREEEAARLVSAVEEVLTQAVLHRGTSFSDYVDGEGRAGDNASRLWVFQREGEPCRVCGTEIVRTVQGARSSFSCPSCQR